MAGYTVLNEPQWNLGVSRGILPHIPYALNISEVSIPTETMHGQMITKFLPFFFFFRKGSLQRIHSPLVMSWLFRELDEGGPLSTL